MVEDQRMQRGRQGEDDVKVLHRQQTCQACLQPGGALACLALGTVAVTTGVVGHAPVVALAAGIDMPTQGRGSTGCQMSHDHLLAQCRSVTGTIRFPMCAENVCDLEGRTVARRDHDVGFSSESMGKRSRRPGACWMRGRLTWV